MPPTKVKDLDSRGTPTSSAVLTSPRTTSSASPFKTPPRWLLLFTVLTLFIGVLFRFGTIKQPVFWYDEAMAALMLTTHTKADVRNQFFDGKLHTLGQLNLYATDNSESGAGKLFRALSNAGGHQSPLYYILAFLNSRASEISIESLRLFTVILSLAVFPALVFLAMELFGSTTIALYALSLCAVSPVITAYSQECRPYILWLSLSLLSSAFFLRALKQNNKRSWIAYAISSALSIYTNVMTGCLLAAHALYAFLFRKDVSGRTLLNFLLSAAASVLVFAPWLLLVHSDVVQSELGWTSMKPRLLTLIGQPLLNGGFVFFALPKSILLKVIAFPLIMSVLSLSLFVTWRFAGRKQATFITLLLVCIYIPLLALDLLKGGGISSLMVRYVLPSTIALILFVSFTLDYFARRTHIAWRALSAVLLVTITSAAFFSMASSWDQFTRQFKVSRFMDMQKLAFFLNEERNPLVIVSSAENNAGQMVALSYYSRGDIKMLGFKPGSAPMIPGWNGSVYLIQPDSEILEQIKKQYPQAQFEQVPTFRFVKKLVPRG